MVKGQSLALGPESLQAWTWDTCVTLKIFDFWVLAQAQRDMLVSPDANLAVLELNSYSWRSERSLRQVGLKEFMCRDYLLASLPD